ncbi:aspartyl/glutamyl-tRNA(Asn/Gln) amidotransferase subunit C [Geoalkalibacter ferrihydriticus]|uniref:Aspartyl/glutamyl-tRNA(Asn/Gln) amidotransferase subunit C n=2 Tax=Geoalkalibacter ferrihydriticus TaxID=392333 RepID=A0A0C2HM99_9BACT|nr:Asp-tRNA(Asn)/Glu-tRNA(Gln) amidotransferase subunit GatC [Geoalkalibacter ferrihydriticus]KIH76090.1 glutamyl-tRNA amidotransferase [Geoalkalibacter ferrihydriticus DSM 17813]SDM46006.1 aspartyl/glutamyl-tRNA(Asn/Gln) amidotransferase subunit C [Geoalkalibacter ferrihydriticus]
MKITSGEVEKVAGLARLALSADEIQALTSQMDAILSYVDKLNELDVADIVPTAHAVPVENALRDDQVRPSIGQDKALKNAPAAVNGCFRVPRVIE